MKKFLALTTALLFVVAAPNVTLAQESYTSANSSQGLVAQSIFPEAYNVEFIFEDVASGSSDIDGWNSYFYIDYAQNINFKVESQSASSGTPNANYYLYDDELGQVVRGPVTVTGTGSSTKVYTFFNVPAGYYKMKVVNNGTGSLSSYGHLDPH